MVDIKGLLSNPMAAYKSASQPGGLLAPVTSMNQFLGDPRVHVGLAMARGESVGDALTNSAAIQSSFAPAEVKVPTTKAVTLKKTGEQVLRTNTEIAANPDLYAPAATGMVTEVGADGGIKMTPSALYGSSLQKGDKADALFAQSKNLANLGNRTQELLNITPIGATGGIVRAIEGIGDQASQLATEFGFNPKDYDSSILNDAIENKYGTSASNNARFKSNIIALAYNLAKIEEPDNPRLSDGDIIRQMDRLGNSQSRETFASGIDETIKQSLERANVEYNVLKGADMPDVGYQGFNVIDTNTVSDPFGLFPEGFPE